MQPNEFDRLRRGFTFEERLSGIDDYFQAAVLAPLLLAGGEYHFVFEKRAPNIRQGGEVCFPGGAIGAADASPLDAALRETHEEIGCKPESVDVVGRLDTLMMAYGTIVHPFLGIIPEAVDARAVAVEEVAGVFTVPLSFFLDNEPEIYSCRVLIHPYLTDGETGGKRVLFPARELDLPAYYSEPWGGADHKIYVYRTRSGLVWGLTARIVFDCVCKIRRLRRDGAGG